MAEISQPWSGITTGDATRAPYSDDEWDDLFEGLFASLGDHGVLMGYLEALEVTGAGTPLTVHTGAALVKGKFYRNDADKPITVTLPTGATRRDWIVLRCCWSAGGCGGDCAVTGAQTIRAVLKQNPDEDLTPPALTQADGSCWEIPLCQLDTTVGGTITLYDMRHPIAPLCALDFVQPMAGWDEAGGGAAIPVTAVDIDGNSSHYQVGIVMPDGNHSHAYGAYTARQDLSDLRISTLFMAPAATGNVRINEDYQAKACGEALTTASTAHGNTRTIAAVDTLYCFPFLTGGGAIAVECHDYLRLRFCRDGGHVDDTLAGTIVFLGWVIYSREV